MKISVTSVNAVDGLNRWHFIGLATTKEQAEKLKSDWLVAYNADPSNAAWTDDWFFSEETRLVDISATLQDECELPSCAKNTAKHWTAMQTQNEVDFLFELRVLLDRYGVQLEAVDDGASYGQHLPLIQVQFKNPFGTYQFASIQSIDKPDEDVRFKVGRKE